MIIWPNGFFVKIFKVWQRKIVPGFTLVFLLVFEELTVTSLLSYSSLTNLFGIHSIKKLLPFNYL